MNSYRVFMLVLSLLLCSCTSKEPEAKLNTSIAVPSITNCSLYLKDLIGSATVKGVYNKGLINRRIDESLSCFKSNGYKGK